MDGNETMASLRMERDALVRLLARTQADLAIAREEHALVREQLRRLQNNVRDPDDELELRREAREHREPEP